MINKSGNIRTHECGAAISRAESLEAELRETREAFEAMRNGVSNVLQRFVTGTVCDEQCWCSTRYSDNMTADRLPDAYHEKRCVAAKALALAAATRVEQGDKPNAADDAAAIDAAFQAWFQESGWADNFYDPARDSWRAALSSRKKE